MPLVIMAIMIIRVIMVRRVIRAIILTRVSMVIIHDQEGVSSR